MVRSGGLGSSLFGLAGFMGFGLWGTVQCQFFGIDIHRFNCGWVFILMAPIGFLAGSVAGSILFRLFKALAHVFAVGVEKLMQRYPDPDNSPDG